MNRNDLTYWMTVVGTISWGACFWWMHLISTKQNALLDQLRQEAERIEARSTIEHDLINQVHPRVGEIKNGMDAMFNVVKESTENAPESKVGNESQLTSQPPAY